MARIKQVMNERRLAYLGAVELATRRSLRSASSTDTPRVKSTEELQAKRERNRAQRRRKKALRRDGSGSFTEEDILEQPIMSQGEEPIKPISL